jgi:hypothetical protein
VLKVRKIHNAGSQIQLHFIRTRVLNIIELLDSTVVLALKTEQYTVHTFQGWESQKQALERSVQAYLTPREHAATLATI